MSDKIRTVMGIGYGTRGGKWKTSITIQGVNKHTREYVVWISMLQRCYDERFRHKYPTYAGCTVAEEWHDFQIFAEWLNNQEFYIEGYHLDKDLLVRGNKIYSPETCTMLPRCLNTMLTDSAASRGIYPIGVYLDKNNNNRFKARVSISGKSKYLGSFDCPQEAHKAYIFAKEESVKSEAVRWKNKIEDRAYQALLDWRVESS